MTNKGFECNHKLKLELKPHWGLSSSFSLWFSSEPLYSWFGVEAGNSSNFAEDYPVLDPLMGTKSLIKRRQGFGVCHSLQHLVLRVAGVAFDVKLGNELISAFHLDHVMNVRCPARDMEQV